MDTVTVCPFKDPECDNFFPFYWYMSIPPILICIGLIGNGLSLPILFRLNARITGNYFALRSACLCNLLLNVFFMVWPCLCTYLHFRSSFKHKQLISQFPHIFGPGTNGSVYDNFNFNYSQTPIATSVNNRCHYRTSLDQTVLKFISQRVNISLNGNMLKKIISPSLFSYPTSGIMNLNLTYHWNFYTAIFNAIILNTLSRTAIIFIILFLCDRYIALVFPHYYFSYSGSSSVLPGYTFRRRSKNGQKNEQNNYNMNNSRENGQTIFPDVCDKLLKALMQCVSSKIKSIESNTSCMKNAISPHNHDKSIEPIGKNVTKTTNGDDSALTESAVGITKNTKEATISITVVETKNLKAGKAVFVSCLRNSQIIKCSPFVLALISCCMNIYTYQWSEIRPCVDILGSLSFSRDLERVFIGYTVHKKTWDGSVWWTPLFIMDILEELVLAILPTIFIGYLITKMMHRIKSFNRLRRSRSHPNQNVSQVGKNRSCKPPYYDDNNVKDYKNDIMKHKGINRISVIQKKEQTCQPSIKACSYPRAIRFPNQVNNNLTSTKYLEPTYGRNALYIKDTSNATENIKHVLNKTRFVFNKKATCLLPKMRLETKFTLVMGVYFACIIPNSVMTILKTTYAKDCQLSNCILYDYFEPILNTIEMLSYTFFFYAYWFLDRNFRRDFKIFYRGKLMNTVTRYFAAIRSKFAKIY